MPIPCDCPSQLLTRMADKTCCAFLSDLRFLPAPNPSMWAALRAIPAEAYTRRCWQAAVCYLTGRSILPSMDGAACRSLLLEHYSDLTETARFP